MIPFLKRRIKSKAERLKAVGEQETCAALCLRSDCKVLLFLVRLRFLGAFFSTRSASMLIAVKRLHAHGHTVAHSGRTIQKRKKKKTAPEEDGRSSTIFKFTQSKHQLVCLTIWRLRRVALIFLLLLATMSLEGRKRRKTK